MDQSQAPVPPEFHPPAEQSTVQPQTQPRKPSGLKWPIILMVWPLAALIGAILLYAVVNFLASNLSTSPESGALLDEQGAFETTLNVILFLVGAASVVVGPISFITGLVLLIVRINENSKES